MSAQRAKKSTDTPAPALRRYPLPPGFDYVPPTRIKCAHSGHVHWTGGTHGIDEGIPMWDEPEEGAS